MNLPSESENNFPITPTTSNNLSIANNAIDITKKLLAESQFEFDGDFIGELVWEKPTDYVISLIPSSAEKNILHAFCKLQSYLTIQRLDIKSGKLIGQKLKLSGINQDRSYPLQEHQILYSFYYKTYYYIITRDGYIIQISLITYSIENVIKLDGEYDNYALIPEESLLAIYNKYSPKICREIKFFNTDDLTLSKTLVIDLNFLLSSRHFSESVDKDAKHFYDSTSPGDHSYLEYHVELGIKNSFTSWINIGSYFNGKSIIEIRDLSTNKTKHIFSLSYPFQNSLKSSNYFIEDIDLDAGYVILIADFHNGNNPYRSRGSMLYSGFRSLYSIEVFDLNAAKKVVSFSKLDRVRSYFESSNFLAITFDGISGNKIVKLFYKKDYRLVAELNIINKSKYQFESYTVFIDEVNSNVYTWQCYQNAYGVGLDGAQVLKWR
jgi:hypothetical protein